MLQSCGSVRSTVYEVKKVEKWTNESGHKATNRFRRLTMNITLSQDPPHVFLASTRALRRVVWRRLRKEVDRDGKRVERSRCFAGVLRERR
jgi:hypothetical protein